MAMRNTLTRAFWSITMLSSVLLGAAAPVNGAAAPFDHEHALYAGVLSRHVRDGRVDYAALRADRAALDAYVAAVGEADARAISAGSRDEQLSFWINAYNALVLRTVIDHYPIERGSLVGLAFPANSIWQIPGAFKERRFLAAGRRVSLDEIEHRIIRPTFREPLVHMALVCAALSCPPLRSEPYRARTLSAQLQDQARRFVGDPLRGMQLAASSGEVRASTIFKWFGEDFAPLGAGEGRTGVLEFLAAHAADPAQSRLLRSGALRLRYLPYDWTLNDR